MFVVCCTHDNIRGTGMHQHVMHFHRQNAVPAPRAKSSFEGELNIVNSEPWPFRAPNYASILGAKSNGRHQTDTSTELFVHTTNKRWWLQFRTLGIWWHRKMVNTDNGRGTHIIDLERSLCQSCPASPTLELVYISEEFDREVAQGITAYTP